MQRADQGGDGCNSASSTMLSASSVVCKRASPWPAWRTTISYGPVAGVSASNLKSPKLSVYTNSGPPFVSIVKRVLPSAIAGDIGARVQPGHGFDRAGPDDEMPAYGAVLELNLRHQIVLPEHCSKGGIGSRRTPQHDGQRDQAAYIAPRGRTG
jgi:hypothetical protein